MSDLFLKIINMSISASWLVLAVLLLRILLKKAPKWVCVLLWGLVAVRLICPFSFESVLSLIPSAETVSTDIMMDQTPEISTGIEPLNNVVNPIISQSFAPDPAASANPLQILIPVAALVWLAGITVMLIYTAVSYWLLRRKVATAVLLRDNLFQSENVDSPFVLGIIRPRIYLPFQLDGQNLEHVVAHERSHISRRDHWWKPIGFLLLSIHWFNPLMWLAYILLCRDIELACDEKVIGKLDNESKADYTQALVACSVNRRSIAACPLAFGEIGVKGRVKSIMNYRKPAFWVILLAVVACIIVAVCFLTNPKTPSLDVLPHIHSHTYEVAEVTYENGMYSFSVVAGENSPIYTITEDMQLASQREHSEEGVWTQLGKLEEAELTKENFDDIFHADGWRERENARNIRKNTANAWQLIYNQDVLYYVLQQKSGELYLAYGYYDHSEKDDPGSDDTNIRWLYKLTIDKTAEKGIVAKSGDNTVPLISFPAGTAIGNYTDSIYWLTIHPDDAEFLPFTLWRDGKEVRGFYNAFDAETFEPIGYFVPSGLDPQTYIFQNADPARAYIVLAVFSTDANAEIYAFGVKFDSTVSSVGGADDSSVTETWDLIPMVMVDGVLYLDTGHNSNASERTDHFDGEITSMVDSSKKPSSNDQSNFGIGYGYQHGALEGTVELYMNGEWRIFATEEVRQQLQFPDSTQESQEPERILAVPEGATPLTEEELAQINAEWFAWRPGEGEYPMSNSFLTCHYSTPEELSMFEVFGPGCGDNEHGIVSDAERSALTEVHDWFAVYEINRINRTSMDTILKTHTGFGLNDMQWHDLDEAFTYLKTYDAYYVVYGGTNWWYYTMLEGYRTADGTLVLLYENERLTTYEHPYTALTLKPAESGDSFHGYWFISNLPYAA